MLYSLRFGSKFRVGSRVQETPEEGQRTDRPKRCEYNKDEDKSLKILNDKNAKRSDGEVPVMLWPGVVPPKRVLSMGQIELFEI